MTKLGAGEILLFYQYLESKSVTITPNRQSGQVKCLRWEEYDAEFANYCSFSSVDEMGQDIITAAKDIIIQRENQRNDEDFYNESDIRIHYKNLQSQVKSLESKIELILKKLNWTINFYLLYIIYFSVTNTKFTHSLCFNYG